MKKIIPLLLILGVQFSAFAQSDSAWKPLFCDNLSNAKYNADCWTIDEKGVLSASKDEVIWANGEYENFVLELEFMTEDGTNSGVIVYCTDKENWIPSSVEIQIADDHGEKWGNSPLYYQCGAIFGHLPANEQKVVKKPGKWNKFQITCKGQLIEVVLNGKKGTSMDMSLWTSGTKNPDGTEIPSWLPNPFAELATKGAIGLQGKHADATIYFRNIKIKSL